MYYYSLNLKKSLLCNCHKKIKIKIKIKNINNDNKILKISKI